MCLAAALAACGHYQGGGSLTSYDGDALRKGLVVAGVLERPGPGEAPRISSEGTRLLVERSGAPDRSTQVAAGDLEILLSPVELLPLRSDALRELQTRLGSRYVMVAEQGTAKVTHQRVWNAAIGVPLGAYLQILFVPIQLSCRPDVDYATRAIRLVDLEQATVLSEGTEVLAAAAGTESRFDPSGALSVLGFGSEKEPRR